MDTRAKELIAQGDYLFDKRKPLMTVWQEIQDHFYPEREPFTRTTQLGDEFADHLMSSFPCMVRRDLGNLISSMLRPVGQEWFHMSTGDDELDHAGKGWLEYATKVQRKAMYSPSSQMVVATKMADHDYITFGQCVLTAELNKFGNGLLHRAWHLKDVVWCDGYDGKPDAVHHKWKLPIKVLDSLFPGKLHPNLQKKLEKDPYLEVTGRRVLVPAEDYDKDYKTPWASFWIDEENQHVMEDVGLKVHPYIIPVWHKANGSQYGHSMATIIALPEARLYQAMTLTLLDAGELATNPPLVAKRGLFRDDFNRYPGGITYADLEGETRLSDALEFMNSDKSGIPFGMDMREDQKQFLMDAFYLNKINLPRADHEMTATESALRNKEFIRNTLPLFEPIEHTYNAQLCGKDFEIMLNMNAFGPEENIPESLLGENIEFKFESPLQDAIDREKSTAFMESLDMLERAAAIDPSAVDNFDMTAAIRDAFDGVGAPTKWINPEEVVIEIIEQRRAQAEEELRIQQETAESGADQQRAVADQEMINAQAAGG